MKNIDEKLDKIHEKLDEVLKVQGELSTVQAEQAKDLKHHIYRSDLNEENIELLRGEVKPLTKAYDQVGGMLKLFGAIAVIAGFAKAAIEVVKFFS